VIRRGRAHTPADESDHLHHRLLRARRQRPSGRRAAEQRDELATFHGTLQAVQWGCLSKSQQHHSGSKKSARRSGIDSGW
jgi:hypothetical protein